MILIFIVFISVVFTVLILMNLESFLKRRKNFKLNKNNLYSWMNMSKKERYKMARNDSNSYLNDRKILLRKIRKEYMNINKDKNNKSN